MRIEIMSRDSIEKTAATPLPEKTAVISITDSDAYPVRFLYAPDSLLRLVFDDIEPESELMDELMKDCLDFNNQYKLITDQQAEEIAVFAQKAYNSADLLICQCEFGQSRSAAVAAAIVEYYYRNGIDVFSDFRYCPNKYVYNKVITMLRKKRM